MRYCSGSGFELLSESAVTAVCHDSNVFLVRYTPIYDLSMSIFKVNCVIIGPGMFRYV